MTVLDVISRHRECESVFKKYEEVVGECICCVALFETLEHVADTYSLDLNELLGELERVIIKRRL